MAKLCGVQGRWIVIAAVLLTCLLGARAITVSSDAHASSAVQENLARNRVASALYAKLATLPQPVTVSEIARALNVFTQNETSVAGATLIGMQGQLLMQVGTGNDTLALGTQRVESGYVPTAQVPIRSQGQLFANTVITFQKPDDAISSTWLIFSFAGVLIAGILGLACIELHRARAPTSPSLT